MANPTTSDTVEDVDLPDGVETNILGDAGLDVRGLDYLEIQFVNTGAEDIEDVKAYKSLDGGDHWDELTDAATGTIAADGSATMLFVQKAMGSGRLRVTGNSAAGSTITAIYEGGVTGA